MKGALLGGIRVARDEEGHDGRETERRRAQEKGDSVGVAKGACKSGKELVERERDAVGTKRDAKWRFVQRRRSAVWLAQGAGLCREWRPRGSKATYTIAVSDKAMT